MTIKGTSQHPEVFASWIANPKLPGFAWLEAVILFLTRDQAHSYFYLNLLLGALSVAAVYRIAWLLSSSQAVAWWSAIFLACLPARITYSMSAASDIAGLFFFLLFLLFLTEYRSQQNKSILYAALFCGIFSICIKPFYVIYVILVLAVVLYVYLQRGVVDRKLCSQIVLDSVCLFLPIVCAIPVFLWSDAKAGNYSLSFMGKNLFISISYLFQYNQNTVLTSLAALAAVGRSIFYKNDNLVNALAGWLLIGLVAFSLFFSGGITYPGNAYSDRYFLLLAFPFVFLAAKGMVDSLTRAWPFLLGALCLIILLVNAIFASNHLVKEAKDNFHYKKTLLLKQVFRYVPDEAYILDGSAALIMEISTKRSIQVELFLSGDHPRQVVFMKGTDELYDSDDPKRMALVRDVLVTEYRCKPLIPSPLKEAYLSAKPFLCTRIKD